MPQIELSNEEIALITLNNAFVFLAMERLNMDEPVPTKDYLATIELQKKLITFNKDNKIDTLGISDKMAWTHQKYLNAVEKLKAKAVAGQLIEMFGGNAKIAALDLGDELGDHSGIQVIGIDQLDDFLAGGGLPLPGSPTVQMGPKKKFEEPKKSIGFEDDITETLKNFYNDSRD